MHAEQVLSSQDQTLAEVIIAESSCWPEQPTEDPIWGLIRIVMAQQISTRVARRLAERVKAAHPQLTIPSSKIAPHEDGLRALGLTERRAKCCVEIVQRSDEIRSKVRQGKTWEETVAGIKGIGPWTMSVFRIMVLRDPDVLPMHDVGLERAIDNVYGPGKRVEHLAEQWRPFRSVACWYLWRTLGNEQLG